MPQGLGRNVYPDLSVRENIEFFGRLFGQGGRERRERIDDLLESTGMAAFADRTAKKLSGGMRQKLGLCCALIHDPDLLILDEPTTGVDPYSRRQFWTLIDRIRARRPRHERRGCHRLYGRGRALRLVGGDERGADSATGSPVEIKARSGAATLRKASSPCCPRRCARATGSWSFRPVRPADHETAIVARDLTRSFGDFTAVDHVSFRIERGEIFGFLGSNGCGKTTTIKMLTGLLTASAGQAWLFGQPIDATDLAMRKRVGYMSQSFSLYAELTVRQNLALHARLFHLSRARAARADRCPHSPLWTDRICGQRGLGAATRDPTALVPGRRGRP